MRPTKCKACGETTYHRDTLEGRVCNYCDAVKPVRARTAKAQAKYDNVCAIAARYGL